GGTMRAPLRGAAKPSRVKSFDAEPWAALCATADPGVRPTTRNSRDSVRLILGGAASNPCLCSVLAGCGVGARQLRGASTVKTNKHETTTT
ncbi:MAG TPA: hypothetical protein VFQ26_03630, partial [Nitrospiraceae bacterium]|nr:hypothetical protein [Nitrospiraceae bacterium]